MACASPTRLAGSLQGNGAVLLPNISLLSDRKKERPEQYESVAETLHRGGFEVGWDSDSSLIQVASPKGTGHLAPTYDFGSRAPGFRPRTSGFLSFGKAKDSSLRPRTSSSVPQSPVASPRAVIRNTCERFTRLPSYDNLSGLVGHANLDSATQAVADIIERGTAPPVYSNSSPGFGAPASHHQPSPLRPGSRAAAALSQGQGQAQGQGGARLSSQVAAHLRLNIPSQNLKDSERPGTGAMPNDNGTSTTGSGHVVHVQVGSSGPNSPLSQSQGFRASRGQALMVFNQLDTDKNGKITRSELEAAAVSLGFSLEQAHRLWDRLDRRRRGFLEAQDWGNMDAFTQIQLFSTRYMQKYMGVPDVSTTPEQARKYWRTQELMQVRTLPAAVNRIRVNALARGAHSASATGNVIYDAFRFMDADGSGELSREELRDAFYSLGVFVSDEVMEQIMKGFDRDGSGTVAYHEFSQTMFPNVR